jgi:hypothetical protein
MSQSHQEFQDMLQSNRRLTPAEQTALDDHLRGCAACRGYAALHQVMLETLPDPAPTRRYSERELRQKINTVSERLERRRGPGRFFRQSLSLAGAGMALALLLLAFYFIPRIMPAKQTAALQATRVQGSQPGASTAQNPQVDLALSATNPTLPGGEIPGMNPLPTSETGLVQPGPASTISLAATASPAAAQTSGVTTLAVEGQTAYTGIGARLVAIDISRPTAPRLTAQSAELPGKVLKVISFTHQQTLRLAVSAGRYLVLFEHPTTPDLTLINQSKLPGPINALILDISRGRIYAAGALQSDAAKGFVALLDTTPADHLELLETIQLPVPVTSLALAKSTLYAAVRGAQPGVAAIPLDKDHFGAAKIVIHETLVSSMAATGDVLYLATQGKILAYSLDNATQPQLAWQLPRAAEAPLPATISGFAVLPNLLYIVGQDAAGQTIHLSRTPPYPLKTASVIDSAACLTVSAGQLVLTGERLEIYDSRDPRQLILLGSLKLALP